MQDVYKKDFTEAISANNPDRQIFKIFTSVPTMMASQGDTKLTTGIKHCQSTGNPQNRVKSPSPIQLGTQACH